MQIFFTSWEVCILKMNYFCYYLMSFQYFLQSFLIWLFQIFFMTVGNLHDSFNTQNKLSFIHFHDVIIASFSLRHGYLGFGIDINVFVHWRTIPRAHTNIFYVMKCKDLWPNISHLCGGKVTVKNFNHNGKSLFTL